jgi:hypothetical protein
MEQANLIEFRDGKPVKIINYRERKTYQIEYNEAGEVVRIIQSSME